MKNIISKYKEIIISSIIILVILSITVIKNNSNYNVITNVSEESRKKDGTIKYIEFIDKDIGYMYKIKDTAMTLAFGTISKTTDGGRTWRDISSGINETFQTSSEVKFFDNNLGYITMPYNGGNTCELYVTTNGGKSFSKVEVDYIELEDTQFKWKEIYDSYNIPTKENGKYYLEVGQIPI